MSGFAALATVVLAFMGWRQLDAMETIASSNTQQTQQLIDAANQIKTAGWTFSGAAIGTNDAVWGAVGKLHDQADQVKRSANSSADAVKVAIQSLHISERAYIVPKGISIGSELCPLVDTPHGNNAFVYCTKRPITNAGKTPALEVVVTGDIKLGYPSDNPLAAYPIPAYNGTRGSTLGAGDDDSTKQIKSTLDYSRNMADVSMMRAGGPGGFLTFGYIQYTDTFGQAHITAYCDFFPADISVENQPRQCDSGNWVDHPPKKQR